MRNTSEQQSRSTQNWKSHACVVPFFVVLTAAQGGIAVEDKTAVHTGSVAGWSARARARALALALAAVDAGNAMRLAEVAAARAACSCALLVGATTDPTPTRSMACFLESILRTPTDDEVLSSS